MMRQTVSVWRQFFEEGTTSQQVGGYALVTRRVPCFIQPATSGEQFFNSERGLEDIHTVYTSDVCTSFERNDILKYGERQFHVVGIKNALTLNVYQELTVQEYPEGARKRLDIEQYE